jgi:hypothetical protein
MSRNALQVNWGDVVTPSWPSRPMLTTCLYVTATSHRRTNATWHGQLPPDSLQRWALAALRSSGAPRNFKLAARSREVTHQAHARLQGLRPRSGDGCRRGVAASNPQGPVQSSSAATSRPSRARDLARGAYGLTVATHSPRPFGCAKNSPDTPLDREDAGRSSCSRPGAPSLA